MIAQKLAIFPWPMLTFYDQNGVVAKNQKLLATNNTQHNTTQHNTTTSKMSRHPTPQQLCPLSSWVGQRRPQILAPHLLMGPLQAPGAGFVHATAGSLVWDEFLIFNSHQKIERSGGALTLGGHRFLNIYNNLMEVGVRGGLYIGEDMQLGWNVRGVTAPSFWLFNLSTKI
jgi:hypothetical protein